MKERKSPAGTGICVRGGLRSDYQLSASSSFFSLAFFHSILKLSSVVMPLVRATDNSVYFCVLGATRGIIGC